jgi:ribosomal protein S27AE
LTNGNEGPQEAKGQEPGVLEHEASIWEVLRKSEEKIRVEKKRLAEEQTSVEKMKEDLFKEKDELSKLKDEAMNKREEAIYEKERISALREELGKEKQKAAAVLGRLDEQRHILKAKAEEVNSKIKDMEERQKSLDDKEQSILQTQKDVASKNVELVKREKEIIEKEKEVAEKLKPILQREEELQKRDDKLNWKEMSLVKEEKKRLGKEKEIGERAARTIEREKEIQKEFEEIISIKIQLAEKERKLLEREGALEESEELEPLETISAEIEGEEIDKSAEELGLGDTESAVEAEDIPLQKQQEAEEVTKTEEEPKEQEASDEVTESEEPKEQETKEEEAMESDSETTGEMPGEGSQEDTNVGLTPVVPTMESTDTKPETESEGPQIEATPEAEPTAEEKKETYEEMMCPRCGTLIRKGTTTCFACGKELSAEDIAKQQEDKSESSQTESPGESAFLKLEKTEEGEEARVPTKDELYTMNDDQLIELCAKYGLDPTGRSKHLRERLIEYIEGGKTQAEESSSAEDKGPNCPDCGKDMSYIEQYGRWYCYSCERYALDNE